MFNRPPQTYDIDSSIIESILKDEANPLNRISQLIPEGSKVLDIGAGNGLLSLLLQRCHKNVVIDGIEPDQYAANLGEVNYRHLFHGFAEDFLDKIFEEEYDFIVLADVLEHIVDPQKFLSALCSGASKSKLILSVPNVAFGSIRLALLNGEFNYVDSGLLERTHIRFFTLNTLETLITNIHMNIEKLYLLQRDIFATEISLTKFKTKPNIISNLLRDELASTYQFLLVLTKDEVKTEKQYFGKKASLSFVRKLIGKLCF